MRAGQLAVIACLAASTSCLVGACAFTEGSYAGTSFQCPGPDDHCPPGFRCESSRCVAETDGNPTADGPTTDAPASDATTDATVAADAPLTICERAALAANADRCPSAATPPGTIYGTTAGYANDLAPQIIATCTGALENGPDAIYRVDVAAGKRLTATLTPDGWDGAVYILTGCNSAATCSDGSNTTGTGNETATVTATAATTY